MRSSGAALGSVLLFVAAHQSVASVVLVNPVADSFVAASQAGSNYGSGGGLAIAASNLPNGEFQSLLRFDLSAAKSALDAQFGAGQWTVQSVSLRLTAASPNSPVFNSPSAAGQFAASWMQNDAWIEGTGTPAAPSPTGITFATLGGSLSAGDEGLGTFSFVGGTSGSATYGLALTPGFEGDLEAGGSISLRLSAVGTTIAYVFNSRNFGTLSARPELSVTAVPGPGAAPVLGLAAVAFRRRRRR